VEIGGGKSQQVWAIVRALAKKFDILKGLI
jgi:hypothetical protein